jgi:hypothetical protein
MSHWLTSLGCAAVLAGALAGCTATVAGPDLVSVGPGVSVIADYDEPVFYSDGFYWRYYGSTWYRSPYYNRGWVYAAPPAAIMSINRPYAYVHYRASGWRGRPVAPPPRQQQFGGGWRAAPPPPRGTFVGRAAPPPAAGTWRGAPAPAPVRPAPAPAARPAPQQGRPAPANQGGGGWRQR